MNGWCGVTDDSRGGVTEGGMGGVTEDGVGEMMEDGVGVGAWARVALRGRWVRHDGCGVTERGGPARMACEDGQPGAGWRFAMGGRGVMGVGQNKWDSVFR